MMMIAQLSFDSYLSGAIIRTKKRSMCATELHHPDKEEADKKQTRSRQEAEQMFMMMIAQLSFDSYLSGAIIRTKKRSMCATELHHPDKENVNL